ncbi:MAG: pyruvate dehydrogenase (acetyl-transferring) E1 component subunit alpha [Planctomycetota bacterium]|jgi:pyruvate dehydrogenase E1 component alpha subunit
MTTAPQRPIRAAAGRKPARQRRTTVDLGTIENLQVLNEQGVVDPKREPKLDGKELFRLYRQMVLTRKLDERMLAMQRQGEMGTFAPGYGQEATQIGQIYPLRKTDWFVPSYRSFGAQLWRGWTIEGLMLLWDGFFSGFEIPEGVNDLPFSIVVGSHVPVAAGIGMAIRQRGEDGVVLTNFGDGAISQGAVNEAFNFAAVYKAPVIFVVENNGYAISIPTDKQCGTEELARRGPGFGMPGWRVDGNDILAMITATTQAAERARAGEGPTLIEAVTYRMGLHTTADDPRVYRSEDEVEQWKPRCPIARFEKYLMGKGLLDREAIEQIGRECEEEVLAGRERFRKLAKANPHEVFDFMYEELPPELEAQKREYLEKLKRKGVE